MLTLRETLLVLVGAEAFHTLSHLWLGRSGLLPMQLRLPHMTVTTRVNLVAVVVNAVITAALFWWAARL